MENRLIYPLSPFISGSWKSSISISIDTSERPSLRLNMSIALGKYFFQIFAFAVTYFSILPSCSFSPTRGSSSTKNPTACSSKSCPPKSVSANWNEANTGLPLTLDADASIASGGIGILWEFFPDLHTSISNVANCELEFSSTSL